MLKNLVLIALIIYTVYGFFNPKFAVPFYNVCVEFSDRIECYPSPMTVTKAEQYVNVLKQNLPQQNWQIYMQPINSSDSFIRHKSVKSDFNH